MKEFEILVSRLQEWQRWKKLQNAIYDGIRGLVLGLSISAGLGAFIILSKNILASTYLNLLISFSILGLILAVVITLLMPQSPQTLARSYDHAFDLKERVSTAIELSQHRHPNPTWQEMQLNDALESTRSIIPKKGLKWHTPKLEIFILIIASLLILGTWFYGQGVFRKAEIAIQNQQLIESEIDNLEALISEIESNQQLSNEDKEALLSSLEETLEDLNQSDSIEEAVSVLSEAQQSLEELGAPESVEFEGLQLAGEELSRDQNSLLSQLSEAFRQGNFPAVAEALEELDLSKLSRQELASLSEMLLETAQQMGSSAPELAKQFQQAAENLQTDDLQSAQTALNDASETLLDIVQTAEFTKTSQQIADNLATSQERMIAGAMFNSSAVNNAAQPNSSESPSTEQKGSFGSQASSGEFEEAVKPGKESGLTPLTPNNTAGGSTEKQYDSIYAPQRLGGTSETELSLSTGQDRDNNALGGINSSFEQNAQSQVPYSEIYSSYEGIIQHALEAGSIPLALQPIVRDYFSSLNPR